MVVVVVMAVGNVEGCSLLTVVVMHSGGGW